MNFKPAKLLCTGMAAIGCSLLWMACHHHMFEVLLSDALGVCFVLSTGSEIFLFRRFKEKWFKLIYRQPKPTATSLITACDSLNALIADQLRLGHPRVDYREFHQLATGLVGFNVLTML